MAHYNSFWTNHTDKFLHFIAGAAIYIFAYGVTKSFGNAIAIVAAIAACKEIYDIAIKRGKFDLVDILATIAGGLSSATIFNLLQRLNS